MNNLYQHQMTFLSRNPDKSALVWSCGLGKTRTAIEWSKKKITPVLIVCPKALKTNWRLELQKWGQDGKVLTKEEFRRDWEKIGHYGQVIIDEVHNGFLTPHFKSLMSKALRSYIKIYKPSRILLLSATVYTSSPWNIFQLATILGHSWDWMKFKYTFFNDFRLGVRIISVPKKGCEKPLAALTKKIADVVNIYDVLDVPLQNHCQPEYFVLTRQQKSEIRHHFDPVPIVRFTQQHEIENGILVGNEFRNDELYSIAKHDRLLALCEENPKIAIVCRYNLQIDQLKKLLFRYRPLVIRGDVKDRDSITRAAEAAQSCVVLIQADCAEGYELPSFPLCVFVSMSYSYTKWEQMCGRFLRMNKPSRTTFLYLLTEGDSVDQGIYDAIKRKEDFKIELFK